MAGVTPDHDKLAVRPDMRRPAGPGDPWPPVAANGSPLMTKPADSGNIVHRGPARDRRGGPPAGR